MKYLAAYALLTLSGKKDINAADIKKLLGDVQATVSDDDINRVISSLKGKKVHELIASGIANIGAPSSGSGSASKAPVVKEQPKKQVKKEQKKKQAPPPVDDDEDIMAGGLFD